MAHIVLCSEQIDAELVLRRRRQMHPEERIVVSRCHTEQDLAMTLARMSHPKEPEPFFTLTTRKGRMSYPCGEIVYVRSGHHCFQLFLADGSEVSSRTIRCSFAAAMRPLLDCGYFLHCERSVVVNLHHVKQVQPSGILLYDGTLLSYPLSRRKGYPLPGGPPEHKTD